MQAWLAHIPLWHPTLILFGSPDRITTPFGLRAAALQPCSWSRFARLEPVGHGLEEDPIAQGYKNGGGTGIRTLTFRVKAGSASR